MGIAQDLLDKLLGSGVDWHDQLHDASLAGVPFTTDSTSRQGEHSVTEWEPVDADGFAVFSGRKLQRFVVSGFVCGPTYVYQRDSLLKALMAEDKVTLIDTYHGQIDVYVERWECVETAAQGGYAAFSIECVQAGELPELQAVTLVNEQGVLDQALAALELATDALTDALELAERAIYVATELINTVVDAIELVITAVRSAASAVRAAFENLRATISDLADFGGDEAQAVQDELATITDLATLRYLAGMYATTPLDPVVTATTPDDQAVQRNAHAVDLWLKRIYTALAIRQVMNDYGTSADTMDSYDAAMTLRDELCVSALDAGLIDLATAFSRWIEQRAQELPRLFTITPSAPVSSIELAQRYYADATRAWEIERRNRPSHPGYMTGEIRLLSR